MTSVQTMNQAFLSENSDKAILLQKECFDLAVAELGGQVAAAEFCGSYGASITQGAISKKSMTTVTRLLYLLGLNKAKKIDLAVQYQIISILGCVPRIYEIVIGNNESGKQLLVILNIFIKDGVVKLNCLNGKGETLDINAYELELI